MPSRRRFLTLSLQAAAAVGWAGRATLLAQCDAPDPFAGGRLLGTLPLSGRGAPEWPLDTLLGEGLDARLFTDLSTLSADSLVTPTGRFFVRTTFPGGVVPDAAARLRVHGLVRHPQVLRASEVAAARQPMGTHLLECAGNSNPSNFGLMSAAAWGGVPLVRIVERAAPAAGGTRVIVSGVDPAGDPSQRSVPGASWVFTLDELARTGAFLATEMNGAPLPPHHGAPVRLVVPGWYACTCIKWVNDVELVAEDVPATSQMREYAARTHQQGLPELARDFAPPVIDPAAMPVRIEKWRVHDGLLYRIVGIVWGGPTALASLRVRLDSDGPDRLVPVCPAPPTTRTWALWSYAWRPSEPGLYRIVIKSPDPVIRTRRLDLYFYARQVWIDEI